MFLIDNGWTMVTILNIGLCVDVVFWLVGGVVSHLSASFWSVTITMGSGPFPTYLIKTELMMFLFTWDFYKYFFLKGLNRWNL